MNSKTTIAINKIAEKIVGSAQMEDPKETKAFRDEIVKACESELQGFVPGDMIVPVVRVAPPAASATPKKTGGVNGYTLYSKEHRAELAREMGEEKAKAFFVAEGGVQKYIPKKWAEKSAEEQAEWNARAKEVREDVVPQETATAVKANLWHPFQKAFPAYLAAEKIVVPFTELATATGVKYQELKKLGSQAILAFIAKYPALAKEKKGKKGATASVVPVEI